MNELKIRAWEERKKRMLYTDYGSPHNWYLTEYELKIVYERKFKDEKLVLSKPMLYIGRKEVNGKNIYEGDILDIHPLDNLGHRNMSGNSFYVVTYYERSGRFALQSLYSGANLDIANDCDDFINDSIKVGTIFENPELVDKGMNLNKWGVVNG